jgi:alpha-ketoglutarate-dependent 2,4-dichlorophenoxyacetate dioxygenase
VQIREITPGFGAEITDIGFDGPMSPEDEAAHVGAIARYGVCVYPGFGTSDENHIWFSRVFGNLWTTPASAKQAPRFGYPHLFDAGNLTHGGEIDPDELSRARRAGDRLWHTDSSFTRDRTTYSLLLAHEVPTEGGETWFADMRAAYDALPELTKQRLDGLEAEHNWWHSRRQAGYPISDDEVAERQPRAVHPLVHVHPGSGRKALYIASHARRILGMDLAEGQDLLAELIEHATQPRFTFAHRWAAGDLVIWDNFATMHRGGDYDDVHERRDMRRTTVMAWPPPPVVMDPRFADRFDFEQFAAMRPKEPQAA